MRNILRAARAHKRWAVWLAIVLIASAWVLRAALRNRTRDWVSVERGDLVLTVDITGSLKAVQSHLLGPPLVPRMWDFKIAMMAPEGLEIEKGTPVLSFDTSNLTRQLEEKKAELDSAQKEIEKKTNDLAISHENDAFRLAEATAKRDKAKLKLTGPSEILAVHERRKLEIDLDLGEKEVLYLQQRLQSMTRAGEAELALLRDQRDRAAGRVRELEASIARMTVTAPGDGTVVYVTNRRGEKKKVGDNCWVREKVLEIPDLSEMKAEGQVDEADSGRIALGQKTLIRLEAYPDVEYGGRLDYIGSTIQPASRRSPLRITRCSVALEGTDPDRMRPGMRFQGRIEIDRVENTLLIPLTAVHTTANGLVAYRRTLSGVRPTALKLGRSNDELAEVIEGLSSGDRVSRHPPGNGTN